jgi:ankyrin repeat protein
MTELSLSFAMIPPMKTNRLILMASLSWLPLMAEEKTLSDGLRDALYLEEVKRDPSAAVSAYQTLLDGYAQQQKLAATACFRLAEIHRTQGRKEEAIALYQRLITEFPQAEAEIKNARENLTALGGKLPETPIAMDEEQIELQRLKRLLVDSPDVIAKIPVDSYVRENKQKIVEWLIKEARVGIEGKGLLSEAAVYGHKTMLELLVRLEPEFFKKEFPAAMEAACLRGNREVVKSLLKSGADPNAGAGAATMDETMDYVRIYRGKPLVIALQHKQYQIVDLLLESGADPSSRDGAIGATPLLSVVLNRDPNAGTYLEKLIKQGADIHALYNHGEYDRTSNKEIFYERNLISFAVEYGLVDICNILIRHGAKCNDPQMFRFMLTEDVNKIRDRNDRNQCITLIINGGYHPDLKIDNRVHLVACFYNKRNLEMAKQIIAKRAKIEDVEPYLMNSNGRMRIFVPPNASLARNRSTPVKITGKVMLTQQAAVDAEPEFLALFLKAGGKLESEELSSAYFLSKDWMTSTNTVDSKELECVKIFVEQGIEPEKEWRNSGYSLAPESIKAFLNERFPSQKPKAVEKPKEDPSR